MTLLTQANHQWTTRPADERFWTVADAKLARAQTRARSFDVERLLGDLRVEAIDGDVRIVSRKGNPAELTHHSFGQLAQVAGAPASYLRRLPATLTAQNINHGLKAAPGDAKVSLMVQKSAPVGSADQELDRGLTLRALTSPGYRRIWDDEFLDLCGRLEDLGWRAPPARPSPAAENGPMRLATEADVLRNANHLGLSVKVGDPIGPAGVYAGDRDSFVFLIDDRTLVSDGYRGGLCRGVFLWNSEVGDKSIGATWFYFDTVCGNHFVHGASGIKSVRFAHVGSVQRRWAESTRSIDKAAQAWDVRGVEGFLAKCRALTLAAKRTEVIEVVAEVARAKRINLTSALIAEGYDAAERRVEDFGPPNTAWGLVSGLTAVSQLRKNAEDRAEIDRAAGRLATVLAG